MGYRNYFYIAEKEKTDKFIALSHEEQVRLSEKASGNNDEDDIKNLIETDGLYCGGVLEYLDAKEIHECGKYFDGATSDEIHKDSVDLSNCDTELCFVKPESLLIVAEHYRRASQEYYEKLLKSIDLTDEEIKENWKDYPIGRPDFKRVFKTHVSNLRNVLNTSKDDKLCICNSWNYDYNMFELVHIYKTINWDKHQLIWCGH